MMPKEIERKFLVAGDGWKEEVRDSVHYRQGYMPTTEVCSVRVRVAGDKAHLNIKSGTLDVTRHEFEYPIPVDEAEELLDLLCLRPQIEKTRHFVDHGEHTWEVDVFEGENAGLVVAEIELSDAEESFALPEWIGEEVSGDIRYYNNQLVAHPFKDW